MSGTLRPGRTGSSAGFDPRERGYSAGMPTERQEIALLRILVATGERALEAFRASDNAIDRDFVDELERVINRSHDELAALTRSTDGS